MVLSVPRLALVPLVLMVVFTARGYAAEVKVGELAPASLGKTPDDMSIMVGDSSGKVTVVTFWASWCAPCRAELPILAAIQKVAGSDQIRVVAVNIEGAWEFRHVAHRLSGLQLTLTNDADGRVSAAYGRSAIPHFVLIGRDGRILKVHRGYDEKQLDLIVADVNGALAAR
jgi:thiol-disulfide isomerase/thioredoxin